MFKLFEYFKYIQYDIFTYLTDTYMNFSPYNNRKYKSFNSATSTPRSKFSKYAYIALSIAIGVSVVWFLQSVFLEDEGTSVYATFEKNTAIAESQRESIGIWSAMLDNAPITEGDTVHIKENNDAKIILPDSSFFSLKENSQLTVDTLRKNDENILFGNITINKAPILFSGKTNFEEEKELRIFIAKNIYVSGGKNTFYFNDNIVSFVDGEKVWISKLDEKEKITQQRFISIGQSLDISTFSLIPTGDILNSSELVAQYKGEKLVAPSAEDTLEESTDIQSPTLISPEFEGSAIVVNNGKQKITGTTPLETEKIIIAFANGTQSEELSFLPSVSNDKKTKKWSYTASEQYKTLLPGINSYKIYAVNSDKKRSSATILLLSYDKDAEEDDENEDSDDTENNTDDENNEKDINFSITAPNQGRDTEITSDTIILNGTAGKDVAYITISNITLDSSYTLQQYKKGQKTWKYWVDELKPDTYKYVVYAKDENKKILSTQKISVTLLAPEPTNNTTTPSPTSASTPVSTPKPVVTTGSPTIIQSTSEISR